MMSYQRRYSSFDAPPLCTADRAGLSHRLYSKVIQYGYSIRFFNMLGAITFLYLSYSSEFVDVHAISLAVD